MSKSNQESEIMNQAIHSKPSKEEMKAAGESLNKISSSIKKIKKPIAEIEIEETGEKIKVPLSALKFFTQILEIMKQGKPFSLMPVAAEMTTQAAAEFLNCSRPHVVKLLEEGKIPYTKIGRHRRIKLEDLQKFRDEMKANSKAKLIEMMKDSEDLNMYDS